MNCVVCGNSPVTFVARYSPYLDFSTDVYDCPACGSRFTARDANAHELLHSSSSSYNFHSALEQKVVPYFHAQNTSAIALEMGISSDKNTFIIETLADLPKDATLMEVGCSRGYLTSYFLASGYQVLGTDISPTAIAAAKASFGDHFCLPDDPRIKAEAPFDAIYHVGTIGCVDDPLTLTRDWLNLLKPGGRLVFNAPNRDACDQAQCVWLSTPPPDLVTLFTPEFWQERFGTDARADVRVAMADPVTTLRYRRNPPSAQAATRTFLGDGDPPKTTNQNDLKTRVKSWVRDTLDRTPLPRMPAEYGIYVSLTRTA